MARGNQRHYCWANGDGGGEKIKRRMGFHLVTHMAAIRCEMIGFDDGIIVVFFVLAMVGLLCAIN